MNGRQAVAQCEYAVWPRRLLAGKPAAIPEVNRSARSGFLLLQATDARNRSRECYG